MTKNVFRKGLALRIIVLFVGICFTSFSLSSSVSESDILTNDSNILHYITARLSFNPGELEVEILNEGIGEGYGFAGPFEFLDYEFGWVINASYLILNGTINVKPLTSPRLTLYPGDKLSVMAYFGFAITDPDGNGIDVGRAFGVTIEKE
ncbi:MAG: hypothetical protein KAW45_06925 [Thermoplasmatales archaeon]|nr:hypothetical protein [Thermoplasmatales archaeon]